MTGQQTETKHTPGPWEATGNASGTEREKGLHFNIGSPTDKGYAHAVGKAYNEADARLIAASPELLEACVDMLEWYNEHEEGDPPVYLFSQLRDAIAKAQEAKG